MGNVNPRMAEKTIKGSPFGSQAARFDVLAVHPLNKNCALMPYCMRINRDLVRRVGPGSYDTESGDFSARAVAQRAKGPGWHRALVTAKEAQRPRLLYSEAWANKHFLKTKVGPGTYEITDFIQELAKKPGSVRGVCDSLEKRFREVQNVTPGPGAYKSIEQGKNLGGCLKMDNSAVLERLPQQSKDCWPAPGTYNLKSSTDILLSKSTSKRGPYDLFTGKRDEPVKSGYLAAPKQLGQTSREYKIDTFVDELNRQDRKKHGVFSALQRFPSTPCKTSPGPGAYEVTVPAHPGNHSAPPFLSSAPRKTKQPGRQSTVAPCRYNIEVKDPRKYLSGPTYSFKSRTTRFLSQPHRDKLLQERLAPRNILNGRNSLLKSSLP